MSPSPPPEPRDLVDHELQDGSDLRHLLPLVHEQEARAAQDLAVVRDGTAGEQFPRSGVLAVEDRGGFGELRGELAEEDGLPDAAGAEEHDDLAGLERAQELWRDGAFDKRADH